MKVKPLRQGYSRRIALSLIAIIAVIATIVVLTTRAKYRNTETLALATGTISYNKADLNIIAMYQEKDDSTKEEKEYVSINKIPTVGYKLSEDSYCEVGSERVEEAEFTLNEKGITIANLQEKGTKCYIYFDSLVKEMLGKLETSKGSKYTIDAMPSPITGQYNAETENPDGKEKLYTSPDNYGVSYVFRGNNNDVNNWVNFAGHTWRIIRINGDGTLRLIFQCANTSCTTTEGATTNAVGGTAYKPAPYDDNTYVGYYYGTAHTDELANPPYDDVHSNSTPSNIATVVDTWYRGTGAMTNYTDYLDGSTGFCNDRTVVKNVWPDYNGNGTGQSASGYAPVSRLIANGGTWRKKQYPTLKCGVVMPETDPTEEEGFTSFDEIDAKAFKRDLFTTKSSGRGNEVLTNPVGLITSDEVAMAGGFGDTTGTNYWLYTNEYYWTMSPWSYHSENWPNVFYVRADGNLGGNTTGWTLPRVRPVVNLKADTTFSEGDGKSSSPFVVAER